MQAGDGLHNYFSYNNLKTRTVQNRFNIIIGLIVLIVLLGVLNFFFCMKIMSGIRAYVGGEGLWSKAQKSSVNNLIKYTSTHDEKDYQNFLKFTSVQLGDKQARLELNKNNPDKKVIEGGFVQGGNNIEDVNDMTFLYRRFNDVSYISSAIKYWTAGDAEIQNMLNTGEKIHNLIKSSDATGGMSPDQEIELQNLVTKTYTTDEKLTYLENNFSATLSDGSRRIADILLQVTLVASALLGFLTIFCAVMIARATVRLDRQKSEFISIASHQLRTPLTTINWYAESLLSQKKGKLNKAQKQDLDELYGGSKRMAVLANDLLRVSSLDLGTYESKVKSVNLKTLLKATLKDQQAEIDNKNISVTTEIDPSLKFLKMDGQLLTIILHNLISNSIKYSQKNGWIRIVVKAKKPHLIISVADNGIGIPKDQQSLVFAKLFRAENARNLSANNSSGLGLYISKAMTELMGGTISFESTENKGTTFFVRLPFKQG